MQNISNDLIVKNAADVKDPALSLSVAILFDQLVSDPAKFNYSLPEGTVGRISE